MTYVPLRAPGILKTTIKMKTRTFMEVKHYFQSERKETKANREKRLSTATSVKQHV